MLRQEKLSRDLQVKLYREKRKTMTLNKLLSKEKRKKKKLESDMGADLESMTKRYHACQASYGGLQIDLFQLKSENNRLRTSCQNALEKCKKLQATCDKMKADCDQLKAQKAKMLSYVLDHN